MKKTWKDLVILNGRVRHSRTHHHLIEHDSHMLEATLRKWMQHNHTANWSKGKYIFIYILQFMTSNKYVCQGLPSLVYAINTNVAKITNNTPYELFFKHASRSDFEVWKHINQSGIDDEENLPDHFFHQLNACKFFNTSYVVREMIQLYLFSVHHCDISNMEANDSNNLRTNNELYTFDRNFNQTFHLIPQHQSTTLTSSSSFPNIIDDIADSTICITSEQTSRMHSSNILGPHDNTMINQGLSTRSI